MNCLIESTKPITVLPREIVPIDLIRESRANGNTLAQALQAIQLVSYSQQTGVGMIQETIIHLYAGGKITLTEDGVTPFDDNVGFYFKAFQNMYLDENMKLLEAVKSQLQQQLNKIVTIRHDRHRVSVWIDK